MKKFIVVMVVLMLTGCTTVNVNKVDSVSSPMTHVCIERNEKVAMNDFLPVLEQGFMRHGIETAVYDGRVDDACEYVLTYTALRKWDMAPFMSYAELRLKYRNKTIGTATYRHSGGFGLNKWASVESKMTPVIDQLLVDF